MPKSERIITAADILSNAEFAPIRKERRAALKPSKALRRVDLGRDCTFYFESFETMLFQVQEMLYIEKGGDAQLVDELSAYNPLIPKGNELVATMMFEIDDPVRRLNLLLQLGGIENHIYLQIGDDKIYVVPEDDAERTSADGKTSSVHFFHFPLTDVQKATFKNPKTQIILGSDHPAYAHMTVLSADTIAELARDFS
ncbi:MAG: DUF3501 family protein [Robiginitomaculum sp.]|nr:DUF3501 family protein [Robiginitomaculum sp.]